MNTKIFKKLKKILLENSEATIEFVPVYSKRFIASALFYNNRYLVFISINKFSEAFNTEYFEHRRSTFIVLHELFHHYMFQNTKGYDLNSAFFKSLVLASGWADIGSPHPDVGVCKYTMAGERRKALNDNVEAELHFDEDFSNKLGFPSFYSISNIKEYFAEVGTYSTLNSDSLLEYIPNEVEVWLVEQGLLKAN